MSPHPNLADLLREHARVRGDQTAVHFPTASGARAWRAVSFAELDAAADRYAHGFRAAGFAPQDRALLMIRPTLDFYGMVFGLFRAGVVPVFIDPGMGREAALGCVARIRPRGLIAPTVVHLVRQVVRKPFASCEVFVTDGVRLGWSGATLATCRQGGPDRRSVPFDEEVSTLDDDAVVVFTSGSTGPPKGVGLTHRCMQERVRQIQALFDLRSGATIVESLLVYTILELCMGMTVVLPRMDLSKPATVDPVEVAAALEAFEPAYASASPIVWQRFVRWAIDAQRRFDHLELLITTAAPIPVDLHQRLRQVVPDTTELFTPYGATEAMPIARIGTRTILDDTAAGTAEGLGTCVGDVAPGTEVRLVAVSDDPLRSWDDATLLPPGEVGEIVARGGGVSEAYREDDAANDGAKIPDPDGGVWHRMGDLGHRDAQGRLWFCGRLSHRLETPDGLVPCVAVEGVFNQHPDVFRTALVGVGPRGAEIPVLCVELEPGARWSDALAEAVRDLADGTRWAGVVQRVLHHDGFPTDTRHNSKIRREDLRPWAAARCADLTP